MSNLQGTTVPSNAFVEKVYINVDLSIEEVVSIIDSANLTYNFASKYTVVDGIEISNILGKKISVNNEVVFRESDSMNTGAFVGWKEGFNGIVVVNKQNSYGAQNDALSSLFSITPLTQPQDGQVIVSKSKLTAIADNIRNQTGATGLITLDEMAKMKLGGTDTSDATATSEDILLGKTAYVNGVKVEGTIEEYDGEQEGGEPHVRSLKKLLDLTKSCYHMFYNNAVITDITGYLHYDDTENVTSMLSMFSRCSKLKKIPQLNTSNVTNMANMFEYCWAFTEIPLLDTSNVTDMYNMFRECKVLKSVPQLNTSNVTNISYIFNCCYELTNIPQLNTSKVTDMSNMFNNCYSLKKVDISYYNLSFTSHSSNFCTNCYSLKTVIIRSFGTSYALNSNAFNNCYHLTGTQNTTYNPNGDKDAYIYVPKNMCDTLKSATNWSTYADQIRALEDYTVDGTTTGDLDESKVNA